MQSYLVDIATDAPVIGLGELGRGETPTPRITHSISNLCLAASLTVIFPIMLFFHHTRNDSALTPLVYVTAAGVMIKTSLLLKDWITICRRHSANIPARIHAAPSSPDQNLFALSRREQRVQQPRLEEEEELIEFPNESTQFLRQVREQGYLIVPQDFVPQR